MFRNNMEEVEELAERLCSISIQNHNFVELFLIHNITPTDCGIQLVSECGIQLSSE